MTDQDLENTFWATCTKLRVSKTNQNHLRSILAPLRDKHTITNFHYLHSLRVGMLARCIGAFMYHEEKPLFFAGTLHDLGKCQTHLAVLGRNDSWSDADQREIKKHVMHGYHLLRGRFDISAEIMVWHHKFQENGYPAKLPKLLHNYRQTMRLLIQEYARIVAIADVYDALHRINAKSGSRALTSAEIRARMFEFNPDRRKLISALYEAKILA